MENPFRGQDVNEETRRFLFAIAFWITVADSQLTAQEQEWLAGEFGEDYFAKQVQRLSELEGESFLQEFDAAAAALTDEDKRFVFSGLWEWVRNLLMADNSTGRAETEVWAKIRERLNLDAERSRLLQAEHSEHRMGDQLALSTIRGDEKSSVEEAVERWMGHEGEVYGLAISYSSQLVLAASADGAFSLWDFEGKRERRTPVGKTRLKACAFLPDGETFVVADLYGRLSCFRRNIEEPVWALETNRGGVSDLIVDASTNELGVASPAGQVLVLDASSGETKAAYRFRFAVRDLGLLGNGIWVVAGDERHVALMDLKNGHEQARLEGHRAAIMDLAVSPDGQHILTGSRDNSVRLWSAATASCLQCFDGHQFSVYGVAFSPDGRRIGSASWDHSLRIWDSETGTELLQHEDFRARYNACVFTDNDTLLGAASDCALHKLQMR